MKILGISAFYHDSAAAILIDGKIEAAAQEERFTRKKHDPDFPSQAIQYCLMHTGIQLNELDAIVFYDKPLLKFERLLETYYNFSPKGLQSFIKAIPIWLNEKMFLKRVMKKEFKKIDSSYTPRKVKTLFPEHHLSHAASAFYPSPFEEAAILTIDGVGEWSTASICYGKGKTIKVIKELRFPHSLGLLYSAFTYFIGFKVNSGEYKLMGLAPYGNPDSKEVEEYVAKIKQELIQIHEDGSLWLNQDYFKYATGLRMIREKKWKSLFGVTKRKVESELLQAHCNLALAIQKVTEEIVIKMAKYSKKITNAEHLCLAGGVALNCVANGKLIKEGIFKDVFVQPASGDAGGAVGAAYAAHFIYFQKDRKTGLSDLMEGAFLGPEYSSLDVVQMARRHKALYKHYDKLDQLTKEVAELIAEGNAIGWFQGRMEFGPRALGNRSILGDARNAGMQKKLNLKIKFRESFRPFAPSVLAEDYQQYFEGSSPSPYMSIVHPILTKRRKQIPENYHLLPLKEKLYHSRSDIPAVTHIDFTARIQTVHKDTNERYWRLIKSFHEKTGYSLLINTSFNVRGEPIVCTPEDAYRCFMRTEMDYLVIGDFLFDKKQQTEWKEKGSQLNMPTLD